MMIVAISKLQQQILMILGITIFILIIMICITAAIKLDLFSHFIGYDSHYVSFDSNPASDVIYNDFSIE